MRNRSKGNMQGKRRHDILLHQFTTINRLTRQMRKGDFKLWHVQQLKQQKEQRKQTQQ